MIKNYTSSVPAFRSVQHIEDKLSAYGIKNIIKSYGTNKELVGVCFIINENGEEIAFKLPARVEECEKILSRRVKKLHKSTLKRIREQSERTAWKLLSDWVDVQMSLIEIGQAEMLQIFLPYVYCPETDQTFFEKLKKRKV